MQHIWCSLCNTHGALMQHTWCSLCNTHGAPYATHIVLFCNAYDTPDADIYCTQFAIHMVLSICRGEMLCLFICYMSVHYEANEDLSVECCLYVVLSCLAPPPVYLCPIGILQADVGVIRESKQIFHLFCHEALRVFHDRLINNDDKAMFHQIMSEMASKHFGEVGGHVRERDALSTSHLGCQVLELTQIYTHSCLNCTNANNKDIRVSIALLVDIVAI